MPGWVGVDFFFVLSGFIIYYVHSNYIGKREKVKEFYIKRFTRVYPVYWIMTSILLLLFLSVKNWGIGYETNIDVIIKSFLLLPQKNDPIVSVGWTLEYEIFFYLMFSLWIYLKPRYSTIVAFIWIGGIIMNSFGIVDFNNNFYLNFIFSNYNIEFIFGCIVGFIFLNYKFKPLIILFLGSVSFFLGWYMLLQGDLARYTTTSMLVFGISFSLIIFATSVIEKNKVIYVPKLLLLISDASYSIYLTHVYIFIFLFKVLSKLKSINPFNEFITITGIFILTIVLGILFHILIEKPLITLINNKLLKKENTVFSKQRKKVV